MIIIFSWSENIEKKDPPPDSELFDSSPKLKLKLSLFSALLLGLPNNEKFNWDSLPLEAIKIKSYINHSFTLLWYFNSFYFGKGITVKDRQAVKIKKLKANWINRILLLKKKLWIKLYRIEVI